MSNKLLFSRSISDAGCGQISGMPPPQKTEIQWVLDALARDPTKTRKGIGEAIGLDKSGVSKLFSGRRALKMREGLKIAEYLGVAPPIGFAEEAASFTPAALAPIYRASADAEEASWRLYRNEPPIDRRARAPHFVSAVRVFGLYAQDESMSPRYKLGELIFVDPARPANPGDDALFVEKYAAGYERVVVGELMKSTQTHFHVSQHGRPGERRLSAKSWAAHLVLRWY